MEVFLKKKINLIYFLLGGGRGSGKYLFVNHIISVVLTGSEWLMDVL